MRGSIDTGSQRIASRASSRQDRPRPEDVMRFHYASLRRAEQAADVPRRQALDALVARMRALLT